MADDAGPPTVFDAAAQVRETIAAGTRAAAGEATRALLELIAALAKLRRGPRD